MVVVVVVVSPQLPTLETTNFVHGSAMQSISLVMSECFLSGRGQGHVSNYTTSPEHCGLRTFRHRKSSVYR